ncbi:MAG TPA: glycosyltransferase family 2 protein [Candidatus Limnocylindrales bacterium]|nr:glycosyltransferase family 2 protein [Candidatus Limnocylindrales bacterium]
MKAALWGQNYCSPTIGDWHLIEKDMSKEVLPNPVVCCVIPCYNVAVLCGEVVIQTAKYVDYVIAVNDGSTDGTDKVLHKVAAESQGRIRVLSFLNNRGKGTALLEGFHYALREIPFDILVTLDGDRQHCPSDIPRLVQACIQENAALVIGERTFDLGAIPLRSRLGNRLATILLQRLYPRSPRDTQSGLRAFQRSFIEQIVQDIKGGRYETELYILLLALERRLPIATVPIPAIYFDQNKSSHFRPVVDTLSICRAFLDFRVGVKNKVCPGR